MIALDTSILGFAVNRGSPQHRRAASVVEDLVNGDRPWALPWLVVHEFLRIVTHPHAVARPLGPEEAIAFVERILASPVARPLGATPRHARVLAELVAEERRGLLGGLEVAAVMREHGVRELLSADEGMRRFGFLTVVNPLRDESWSTAARPARRYRALGAIRGAR